MAKHQPANTDGAQTASPAPSAAQSQARILAEALPYMQRYSRQTVVVKFGGHAMGDPALLRRSHRILCCSSSRG